MNDRVLKVLELSKLTITDFATKINVGNAQISHLKTGRNQASLDIVTKILQSFPEISPDWLILGKGDIYRNGTEKSVIQENNTKKSTSEPFMKDLFEDASINGTENRREIDLNSTEQTEQSKPIEVKQNFNSISETTKSENTHIIENTKEEKKTANVEAVETPSFQPKKDEPQFNEVRLNHTVRKILVFYSDKTYEEFTPNNDD